MAAAASPAPNGWVLAWADEFGGSALDGAKWIHWLSGPRRDAVNTAGAVVVSNGLLTISTYTSGGTHYTGMIATSTKYSPDYGYLEARVDYRGAPGMWSAFWMQSPTMGSPVGDPEAAGTEIDICEHRAFDGGGASISNTVVGNIHWDGYGADHKSTGYNSGNLGLGAGFHVYGLEWTPDVHRFYVDGVLTWTVSNGSASPVSQRSEFIILSSEVEDASWAGDIPAGGYGSSAAAGPRMIVDYVRVYKRSETMVNGDLEGRAAPFNVYGGAAWSPTGGRSGAALRLAPASGAAGAEQTLLGLVPETDYVLTGWGDADGYTGFSLGVKNYGGVQLGQGFNGTNYAKASLAFTTGVSGTSAVAFAYAATAGTAVYADDLLLRRAAAANNPQLESGELSPWTRYGGVTVAREGSTYGGDWSVKLAAGASAAGAEQEIVGLRPATDYRFSAWTVNGGQGLNIGAKHYAGVGTQVSTTVVASAWSRGAVAFRTGATNTTATVFAWRASSTADAHADAFFLCEPLPAAWSSQDVTAIPLAGAAGGRGGQLVVRASGADIWGTSDRFHFVHRAVTGDVQVAARVLALDRTHAAAKAGVMIRQGLNSNVPSALLNVTPAGGLEFIRRSVSGGTCASSSTNGVGTPVWLSLLRRGNGFSAYWSKDGAAWFQLGMTQTIAMPAAASAGLATCAHDEALLAEAVYGSTSVWAAPCVFTNSAAGAWSAAPWQPVPPGMTLSGSNTVNVFNNGVAIASTNDLGSFMLNGLRFVNRAVSLAGGTLVFDGVSPAFVSWSNAVHAISCPLALNQATTFAVAASTTTLAGALSGAGGVIKTGVGTLALAATNTFTGALRVDAGALRLAGSALLSTNVAVNVASNAVFDVGAGAQALAGFSGAGTLRVAASPAGEACGRVRAASGVSLAALRLEVEGLGRLDRRRLHEVLAAPPGGLSGVFRAAALTPPWALRYDAAAGRVALVCSRSTLLQVR